MKIKILNLAAEGYEMVKRDLERGLYLCWRGGRSKTINVYDEADNILAVHTLDHEKKEISVKRISDFMYNLIETGDYNWI